MVDKKIPELYEMNAPRFDDENPEELPQLLENIERLMEIEGTDPAEKNTFIVRYTTHKTQELWKKFDS